MSSDLNFFLVNRVNSLENKFLSGKPHPSDGDIPNASSLYRDWIKDDAGCDLSHFLEDWIESGDLEIQDVNRIQKTVEMLRYLEELESKSASFDALKVALKPLVR